VPLDGIGCVAEAIEWAKRVPAVRGSKIEVRRVPEEDEVPQDSTVQS